MTRGIGFVDTKFSGSRYTAQQRPILPLDIVSTAPTPVVFHEPIPHSIENNIINDLYGKAFHAFKNQ